MECCFAVMVSGEDKGGCLSLSERAQGGRVNDCNPCCAVCFVSHYLAIYSDTHYGVYNRSSPHEKKIHSIYYHIIYAYFNVDNCFI